MPVLLNHRPYRRYRRLEHIVRISGRLRGHVNSFVLQIDFWRHLFDLPRRSPELPRHPDRINGLSPPPGGLVAKAMIVPVMGPAERDREFVADFASHRAGLSESQMVGVSGLLPQTDRALTIAPDGGTTSEQRFKAIGNACGAERPFAVALRRTAKSPQSGHAVPATCTSYTACYFDICRGICYKSSDE